MIPLPIVKSPCGPTYDIALVKQRIAEGRWIMTHVAFSGMSALGLDKSDVADCLSSLCSADFHKTMDSEKQPGCMLDVYLLVYEGCHIYLKLKITDMTVVVSFKEDDSK